MAASIFSKVALANTRTVVVGGSSGVGLHVARQVVASGGTVVIMGRTQDKLDAAIGELGEGTEAYQVDATNEDDVKQVFSKVGTFDHLVLSSGGAAGGMFMDQSKEQLAGLWDAKYWGEVIPARYGAEYLKEGGGSSITFVGGFLSRKPFKGASQKVAVNAALEALARGLAVELAPTRVNVVAPDGINPEQGVPRTNGLTQFQTSYFDVAQTILGLMLSKNTTGFTYDSSGGALL